MDKLRKAAATRLHLHQVGAITVRRRVPVRPPLESGEASAAWIEYELIATDELEDCDVRNPLANASITRLVHQPLTVTLPALGPRGIRPANQGKYSSR